jgi:exportin-7
LFSEGTVSSQCASCIDHFATYVFLNQNREKPTVQLIRAHIASDPSVLNELTSTLFNALLFSPNQNQWSLTRPILSLLLASENAFLAYQSQLLQSQSLENQEKIREEFAKLTADIQRSVETTNRDRFTQKLTVFRMNVRQFMTL